MVEMDPGLDTKLQMFFGHIEASPAPSGLTGINLVAPERSRRAFNLFAGLAAATVVAASVTVLALELRAHETHGPAAAATSAPTPSASVLPPASLLKKMPLLGEGGVPTSAHVVIPLMHGQGSLQLQTFVPEGTLYIQFDCSGPGPFKYLSTDHVIGNALLACSSSFGVSTITVGSPGVYDNKPLTLQVTADPAMTWQLYIAESRAPLPQFPIEADERVLVPVTYGTGSVTLPTFSVGPGEWLKVREACNSGGSADTLEMTGNNFFGSETQSQCSNFDGSGGGGSGSGPPGAGGSGPISLRVKADPSISWEIVITEGPGYLELPTPDVQVAPVAFGMGTVTLPAFTPAQSWSIAVVCSGVGTVTIGSSNFTHAATPGCVQETATFTPPEEVPGQPVTLSVEAPPGVGWEIYIYRVGAPSSPAACSSWFPEGSSPRPCVQTGG